MKKPHRTEIGILYNSLKEDSIVEEQEDTFLEDTVFTAPAFRRDIFEAERAMQVQYEEDLSPKFRSIVGRPATFQKYRALIEKKGREANQT